MTLVEMTLAGSMIILLTIVVRSLAIHRLPKGAFSAMWALAVLRLLIPFRLPSRMSAFGWFASKGAAPKAAVPVTATVMPSAPAVPVAQSPAVHVSAPAVPVETWIWLAGMTLCILAFAAAYLRGLRRFRESCPEERPEARRWLDAHPLRRKVRIMRTDRVSAPLTYGLFRPVILLPKKLEAEGGDLKMILCHEWMHIRRMDALRKLILALTACVHWFNPLVWAMFILANRDIELACDEQVLRMNRRDVRRTYAMALIHMEAKKSHPAPLCSHFAQNAIEERITSIMKMKKRNALTLALAAVLVLTAGAAFATSAPVEGLQRANNVVEDGDLRISDEDYRENYAVYEPYGLVWNAEDGRLYYQGKKVRCFEDMYPIDDNGNQAGCVLKMPDGEVDVHAVRDLSGPIVRNEDGSFDPSGVLLGLEAATQEEFDARTERNIENYWNIINEETELEWWTEEDFAAWIEQERTELQALIGTEGRCWTPSEGWFTWDQAHVDAAIAEYEEMLKFIQDGGRVSRSGWEDGNVLMVSPEGKVEYAETYPEKWDGVAEQTNEVFDVNDVTQSASAFDGAPQAEDWTGSGIVEQAREQSVSISSEGDAARPQAEDWTGSGIAEQAREQSVSISNEGDVVLPQAEDWTGSSIVEQAREQSVSISSEGDAVRPQAEQASDGGLNPEMFAEYVPFGLSVENNALYFQGQRVRSFSDRYQADLFRTVNCEHEDPEGTITVQAVRENGRLMGLEIVQ